MKNVKEFNDLVAIPHDKRTVEQRVRICELSIGQICSHLTKIDKASARNEPAIRAAMMHVKLD